MLFKDRVDAGKQLAASLDKKTSLEKSIVVSLLRGGVIVGDQIAKKLTLPHLPLIVKKISAPHQPELAIGAVCFQTVYLEKNIIRALHLSSTEVSSQIKVANLAFADYCQRFNIKQKSFSQIINSTTILVDDGIATGSTIEASRLFLMSTGAKKIILAAPVAPADFVGDKFNSVIILHRDPCLSAISHYYQDFRQVEDKEVNKILNPKF